MMDHLKDSTMTVDQQSQMLKLITQSFCKELVNYGIARISLASVAVQVLDYVMDAESPSRNSHLHENLPLKQADIVDHGKERKALGYGQVSIRPLSPDLLPTVVTWLATTDVQRHFAVLFPKSTDDLYKHFFETPSNSYFGIFSQEVFVGVIGGEHIDTHLRKLEMKKFIGDLRYRGLGIGKTATFLWLHHIFDRCSFNKVYIYSIDTNIRNINLNSKLGFELEGVLFEDTIVDGVYCDVARMSLLKARWETLFSE